MRTWIHRILVGLYASAVGLFFLMIVSLSGVHIANFAGWGLAIAWTFFCFASGSVISKWQLFRKLSCRLPATAEEEKLAPVLQEVLKKANCQKPIRVLIEEESEWNAYALGWHTIVISKTLLQAISQEELAGLLAHELGHLLSGDTLLASAFLTAGILPRSLKPVFRWARWLILFYLLFKIPLLWSAVMLALFVIVFKIADPLMNFVVRGLGRLAEYEQDNYASRLGYGVFLRQLLERFARSGNQEVNPYYIMMKGSHPGIYNRIRRLEQLERKAA